MTSPQDNSSVYSSEAGGKKGCHDWFVAPRGGAASWWLRGLHTALILAVLAAGLSYAFAQIAYHWNWGGIWVYRARFVDGWLTTLALSALALALSLGIGLLAALGRRSRFLPFRQAALVYVELIRGTPLLVQILIFFYVVANAFGVHDRFFAGALILSLFAGAYIREIIRAGIKASGRASSNPRAPSASPRRRRTASSSSRRPSAGCCRRCPASSFRW